jgi:choline-sulfatase
MVSRILLFVLLLPICLKTLSAEKPNIVFIFADDQCFETLGALGNDEIHTPHLDQLAARGTVFTHAYNMGGWNGAICQASRTMLNTGRSLWNAHSVWKKSEAERKAGRWWSEYMKAAGYRTYMTGKWHCEADADKAFDVAADVRPGMPEQTKAGYNRPLGLDDHAWSPSDPSFGGYWQGGTHWSEVVANHSQAFLQQATSDNDPFFMYLAFNAPHDPRQSPQSYVDRYPLEKISVPENFLTLYPYADAIGCGKRLRDEKLAPFPRTEYAVKVNRQEYYAIITHMDEMIGRILEAVEQTGKADNTWIFFTADHGLACGQHGLIGKQNLYDHSLRVPFIVAGPGVKQGDRIDDPIYLQDIMPTTLELAGIEKPKHVDFDSLLPVLRDGESMPTKPIYGAYIDLQRCIRTDTHKLIVYPKAKKLRLYDIQADPREMHDLASEPSSAGLVKSLFGQLQTLQTELGDPLDLSALAPKG